jgi:hypothetical protein
MAGDLTTGVPGSEGLGRAKRVEAKELPRRLLIDGKSVDLGRLGVAARQGMDSFFCVPSRKRKI